MTTYKETSSPHKPEIDFSGPEVHNLIKSKLKLGTIRLPGVEEDTLIPGEAATAHCERFDITIRVLQKITKPLKDIPPALLLLDGFLSPEEAAQALQHYYPDKEITVDTPMLYVLFMSESSFRQLQRPIRDYLTHAPAEESICNPICRPVFFPSLATWLASKHEEKPATEWFDFLLNEGLAHVNELEEAALRLMSFENENYEVTAEDFFNRPGKLEDLLLYPDSEVYQSMILFQDG
jgi:hypothetical protein